MKRKLKNAVLVILVALSILSVFTAVALADTAGAENTDGYNSVSVSTEDGKPEEISGSAEEGKQESADKGDGNITYGEENASEEVNFFATVYDTCLENADKILSALSFIFSMLIMILLRRGILPSVRQGLSGVSSAVIKIKSESEQTRSTAENQAERISALESSVEEVLREASAARCAIESGAFTEEIKGIKAALLGELEMLREIFLSSSLPKYQKDSVSEKFKSLKKEISRDEAEE